jgi:ABC-type lipoprotein export system ATPase subunit
MNDPRGSLWRKWDLHVHTPASIVHQYAGADPWAQFLDELEALPPEFKVIGINDYIFLDGYRRIIAEKAANRLQNIDLFLPVIELRVNKFGGTNHHLSRVNYHVIFSDELSPDLIEQQFLNALSSKYQLSPAHDPQRIKWKAIPTRNSLEDLGRMIIESVPAEEQQNYGTPLVEGFNNLCLSLDAIREALASHYFEDKYLTAVGKTEWADIKWNDHSIAEKKTIINGADFVFIAAETIQQWENAKKALHDAGVNDLLLDCSDAHTYMGATNTKDRLGHCYTWIKADTTFAGLRQVLVEPADRLFVGAVPKQIERVKSNPTKYLRSIEIKRKANATIGEVWFDNTIPLNPGLVAIIGNKGKGKSALTDIIGLLANTRQHQDFTFLSSDNFRQAKENKAKHFQATVTLESNTPITRGLEETVDEKQPELVKYIPQGFLETICTQLGRIEESDFDRELKKVIFSHVERPGRLNMATLDELIGYKTTEAIHESDLLKEDLQRINAEIITLEDRAEAANRQRIENLVTKKEKELAAHDDARPPVVEQPIQDPEHPALNADIEAAKAELAAEEERIAQRNTRRAVLAQNLATVDRISARLENLQRQVQGFHRETEQEAARIGITTGQLIQVTITKEPLEGRRAEIVKEQQDIDTSLDPTNTEGLLHKKVGIEARINDLQNALDEPNRRYQAYEAAKKAWERTRGSIIGDATTADTLEYCRAQLADLDTIPDKLAEARARRLAKSREIHEVIRRLAQTYGDLYAPVNKFIETRPLANEKFQLNFDVAIVDTGFQAEFFDLISQGVAGSFCGIEPGSKLLKEILSTNDFTTAEGIEAFLNDIAEALHNDRREPGKAVRVKDQLRKGKTAQALYDFIFSLRYLEPRYELRMGAKELSELSPGERGTLLLVFYLLVDKDDIPLLIDQPEENLDNQTVFELLVPCMKEAKQRRQLFMVTHNPNLAVVCDAEQIIWADLQKNNNHTMQYLSGAIENPKINQAIVDILEGTMPAFHNRQDKYFEPA